MSYRVHVFCLTRVATNVEADTPATAVDAALNKLEFHRLLDHFNVPKDVEMEYAEEISHFMVDKLIMVNGKLQPDYKDAEWFVEDDGEVVPIVGGRHEPVLVADLNCEKVTVHCNMRKCTLHILDRNNGTHHCIEGKDMNLDPTLAVMEDFIAQYGDVPITEVKRGK